MKKALCTSLVLALLLCLCALNVSAASEEAVAYVTIADVNGELVLAAKPVTLENGTATIDEVLTKAHDEYFKGGAAAGYASSEGPYGLAMDKLWGIDGGGSYGYCVNDTSAMNLTDEVKAGDHLYAYIYRDVLYFSDTYGFFDLFRAETEKGDVLKLTLSHLTYDESWNTVVAPVADAFILLNGEKTALKTDENGTVTVPCEKAGKLIVSAEHGSLTLVPPVCVVTVLSNVNISLISGVVSAAFVLAAVALLIVYKTKYAKK